MNEKDYYKNNDDDYSKRIQERRNQERDRTYKQIDESAKRTANDNILFKQYLDVQSKFSEYSVGNALLISLNMPQATYVREKEDWEKIGIRVKDKEQGFNILEPSHSKNKTNKIKATYYNPKKVFDISQTDAIRKGKYKETPKSYSDRELLKAFIHTCPAKVEAVNTLDNGIKGAKYDKEQNKFYICRGMETNELFKSIASELANMEMVNDVSTEEQILSGVQVEDKVSKFKSDCVAYMICKKYGVDVSIFNFYQIPKEITNKDVKEFRRELSDIRTGLVEIDHKLTDYFADNQKVKTAYER